MRASRSTTVATGLSKPTDIAWRHGDTRMYVTEQTGTVRIVAANGTPVATPVLTVPVSGGNEQGMLGLTFSADGTKLYVDYTDPAGNIHVDEYTMNGDVADTTTKRQLLLQAHTQFANHNGGEITFGPDGMLYIGIGDGGSGGDPNGNGQNLNTWLAKILRINPNQNGANPYSVPSNNPFVGQSGKLPEIWMYGLRNPWRFSFDRSTGDMWIGDVGQDLYEEIDTAAQGQSGINWGWNLREGLHPYNGGAEPPGAQRSDRRAPAQRRQLRGHRRLRLPRLRHRRSRRFVRVRRQLPAEPGGGFDERRTGDAAT